MEKYDYEFSQYTLLGVDEKGLFHYNWLDYYWKEKNRWAFFIMEKGELAGFAMVNDFPESDLATDYSMAEFFVLYKFRRQGIGKQAAHALFSRFQGKWQLRRHHKNVASVAFWDKAVGEYTNGCFTVIKDDPQAAYEDGTIGEVLLFDTSK